MCAMIELAYEAFKKLVKALGSKIVAIALFGSLTRKEKSNRSDFDFFVVVKDFYDENSKV